MNYYMKFINFIKSRKGFTGCYIAEIIYPGKEIA